MNDNMIFPPQLTSTTAPGKIFISRTDLQNHYRSDWHRYNLRRREAGLPMLNEADFTSRLEAALAIRKERVGREDRSGTGHLSKKSKNKDDDSSISSRSMKSVQSSQISGKGKNRRRKPAFATVRGGGTELDDVKEHDDAIIIIIKDQTMIDEAEEEEEEEPPEINPCQCPFDSHISTTPTTNLLYMKTNYSFFLPDYEYISDLEGFLGYCNEKVRWGTTCLYCQKSFTSAEGTVKHMRDKRHCKILYESGVDMEEYDVFYDFTNMYNDDDDDKDDGKKKNIGKKQHTITAAMDVEEEGVDANEDEEEWEDVSSDEEYDGVVMNESDEIDDDVDDDLYATYEREVNTRGINITPLGELIFPDGRIVGHRGLARYYKQRFAPDRMDRAAVRHAKEASGDRLYHGRVVNLHRLYGGEDTTTVAEGGENRCNTTALAIMGRMSGSIPTGRNGKGILVSTGGGDNNNKGGNFTSLSLYRYRAAVKKQRKEDDRGKRLQYRQTMNMNKMNKKGNNITTGVVTSQQPR